MSAKSADASRHVLVVEAAMSQEQKVEVFGLAERVRKAGNELTGIMRKRLEQLNRTKKYRKLKARYAKSTSADVKKALAGQMKKMQQDYGVTWDGCRKAMIPIGKKYTLQSVPALSQAEDVWQGVQSVLYGKGRELHFKKRGDLPEVRAKQNNRAIRICTNETGGLVFRLENMAFGLRIANAFQAEEADAIAAFLTDVKDAGRNLTDPWSGGGAAKKTLRPCYASLVCDVIRGKLRVFVHITIEGLPFPKRNADGSLKHAQGRGTIGVDIGPQTAAWACEKEVGLKNLAERGASIERNEKKLRSIQTAIDRSGRAMNPENYNADGTVKRGPKKWKKSKRGRKLESRAKNLRRKAALSRRYAIREDVNHLRSPGHRIVTEPKNAAKLARRARPNPEKPNARRRRFGRSIRRRCPGTFQELLKERFERTGGCYEEVPDDYRASQYDVTNDTYTKKALGARMYPLANSIVVQRDMYSAYLLSCACLDADGKIVIDRDECRSGLNSFIGMQEKMIREIQDAGKKVMNSGIPMTKSVRHPGVP